ncbi:MAG: transporter transrane protein [Firmicutes bacterium]|nr:transporter transrane protein [Bacillota bacterium]
MMDKGAKAAVPTQYRGYQWFVLAAGILMMFITFMTSLVFAPLMGVIANGVGVSIGAASFGFMGIMMFANAIFVLFWGYLVDKIGIFRVILGGLGVLFATHLLYPVFGNSYNAVVVLRVLTAFGGAPGLIMIEPIVSRWIPVKQRGFALGLNSLSVFGAVTGYILGPMLVGWAGNWQAGLAWLSVIIGAAIIYVMVVAYAVRNNQPTVMPALAVERVSADENFLKILGRNPAFWLGLAVMALSNWANNAFNDLSPGYLAVDPPIGVGYGPEQAGRLASGNMVGIMLGIFVGGIIIDKIFKGRSGLLVMVGFIANLIFFNGILFPEIHSNPSVLSGWLLATGFVNPFTAVGNQYFAVRSFSYRIIGKVAAAWTCISNFVGSFGVMIGSYALHTTGNYYLSFIIVAVICILGFIAALVSRERRSAIETNAR